MVPSQGFCIYSVQRPFAGAINKVRMYGEEERVNFVISFRVVMSIAEGFSQLLN